MPCILSLQQVYGYKSVFHSYQNKYHKFQPSLYHYDISLQYRGDQLDTTPPIHRHLLICAPTWYVCIVLAHAWQICDRLVNSLMGTLNCSYRSSNVTSSIRSFISVPWISRTYTYTEMNTKSQNYDNQNSFTNTASKIFEYLTPSSFKYLKNTAFIYLCLNPSPGLLSNPNPGLLSFLSSLSHF